jgi:predicted metal-dependent phosphoesterase TrpH
LKIDLHVHSQERSPCGRASEDDIVRTAGERGLDALVFTDHDCLTPLENLEALNRKYAPFRVFGGIEISLTEHILVFGVRDPALESRDWNYPDLWHFVRQRGGFIGLAHPFRFQSYISVDIEHYPPDGIEIASINTSPSRKDEIQSLAKRLHMRLLRNSDSHSTRTLGEYFNTIDRLPENEQALVEVLKKNL